MVWHFNKDSIYLRSINSSSKVDSSVFSGKGVAGWGERQGIRTYRSSPLFSQTSASPSQFNFEQAEINIRNFLLCNLFIAKHHRSFRCGKNCITCRYITDGRSNYTFSATGEIRTIHGHIDCNSKSYLHDSLSTLRRTVHRWNEKTTVKDRNGHRRSVDRPTSSSRPTAVSDHFLSDNHSPNDI